MTYPTGILENTETNKFHPISFCQAPLGEGTSDNENPIKRHKSIGSRHVGMNTLEEAEEWIAGQKNLFYIGSIWKWSGNNAPKITAWFDVSVFDTD